MAAERNGRLGDEVGYHVRFDRRAGPHTRILAVTPGILLRTLHDDPFLEATGAVLFDEFHERASIVTSPSVWSACSSRPSVPTCVWWPCRQHWPSRPYRPISVTAPSSPARADCSRWTSSSSQSWNSSRGPWRRPGQSAACSTAPPATSLYSCPDCTKSVRRRTIWTRWPASADLAVLPLYGDLPPEQQDAALLPGDRRKIVLATNVAETSVTVEGVTGVVDTGLARTLAFDPGVGLDRLRLVPIARAAADQRAGRAGRTQPGVCVRLWSQAAHRSRPEQEEPEVRRGSRRRRAATALPGRGGRLEIPLAGAAAPSVVAQALDLLRLLEAADEKGVTALGRTLARLPVHPRWGGC